MAVRFLVILIVILTHRAFSQTADVNKGCFPLQVSFTAPLASTHYFWDFKDGVTSDKEAPINIFTAAGTYNVTFQESPTGPVLGTIAITVYENPSLSIKTTSGCAPFTAQFQNTSVINPAIQVLNYQWVFGDGNSFDGLTDPTNLYQTPGIYDVSLKIETDLPSCNGTTKFDKIENIIAGPVAIFTTTPASLYTCDSVLNVAFVNKSTGIQTVTYSWDLGNKNTSALLTPPAQKYTRGQYTVALTASYNGITGCTTKTSANVSVGAPIADILIKDTVCLYTNTEAKTTATGYYKWYFGPGIIHSDSTVASENIYFNTPGFQNISLTVTSLDYQCSSSNTKKVYVDQVIAKDNSIPLFSCKNPLIVQHNATASQQNVSYLWNFADGSTSTDQSVQKTYNATAADTSQYEINGPNIFDYSVLVTSKLTGCSDSVHSEAVINFPNAKLLPDSTKGCAPLTLNFTDISTSSDKIVNWYWIFGDGSTENQTAAGPVVHTYQNDGTYLAQLIIVTAGGCTDTSYAVVIQVGKDLSSQIDFSVDKTSVCPGQPVEFSVTKTSPLVDAYHFSTEDNRSFQCQNEENVSWSYNDETGPQDVTLTVDYNGCYSSVTKKGLVTVNGAIAKINYFALCSDPLKYNFQNASMGATKLTWNFGDGQSSTADSVLHPYAASRDYPVTLTAENTGSGCAPTSDIETIHVRNLKAVISMKQQLCINEQYLLSADSSIDVNASCYTGYTWQFPSQDKRPYTSASASAYFTFDQAGVHKVLLIVQDINECKDTAVATFKVYDMVVNAKPSISNICIPTTVQFSDLTIGDTTLTHWNWNFGDGQTASSENPSHAFLTHPTTSDSTFDVLLTVQDTLGCSENFMFPIQYYKPVSKITASKLNICLGDTITLSASDYTTAGSHLTYSWNFGNGTTSTAQTNRILYDTVRSYQVKLDIKEISSGCENISSVTVNLQSYPTVGMVTDVDSLTVLCAVQNIKFSDASSSKFPLTYLWNSGSGVTGSGSTFTVSYPKGTFTATHTVSTSYGCSKTTSRIFKIYQPEGDFNITTKDTICKGDDISFQIIDTSDVASYTWAFGDGNVLDNVPAPMHQYNFHPPSGTTVVKLVLRGAQGICPVEVHKNVYIREVITDFQRLDGKDSSICFNDGPYLFTNESVSVTNYLWNFGDGTTSTNASPSAHQYASPGIYNVTLSGLDSRSGCKDTIMKKAYIFPNPDVIATGDTVCLGSPVQLNIVNPVSTDAYAWSPSGTLSNAFITNPVSNATQTIIYQVTATDTNNCTGQTSVPAIVIEPINLHDWDTSIVIGDMATLPVFGQHVYNFSWTPTQGLSCLTCNYPTVRPLHDTTYTLQVTDVRNCFTASYVFTIEIKPETFVKLPTTFSPNDDHHNDTIYVQGWGIKELVEFQIFNRWGQMIFVSNDLKLGWDGRYNGVLQNSDMYVYKVKVITWREETLYNEGYINLIH
jgi:gliding motility-associated-like protein